MKTVKLLFTLIIAIAFIGCKKEFNCECTNSGISYEVYLIKASTKKKANEECLKKLSEYKAGTDDNECHIK